MSCPSPNEYISKKEDEESEDEDKIISKYILELKNEETRDEALKKLYYFNEKQREKIALYLWYSGGCMAVLLQELIKLYQYLPAVNLKKITTETYNKAVHILFFFQSLASNSQTKKELIESGMLVYAFPFLSIVPNSKYSFMIKVSVLSLLNTLVTKFDIETFNFLKQNQIIPIILKIILNGKEMDKSIALHILVIITSNVTGLEYLCDVRERIKATEVSLAKILLNDDSSKLKKMALKILLNLTENSEAKNMLKKDTLKIFNNFSFYKNLDENAKIKAKQLEKILQDCDTGLDTNTTSDSKIQKLKNDLTINSNISNNFKSKKNEVNNLHNLNLTKSNSTNNYNNNNNANQKQMKTTSGEYNNKLNLNMMFINNMNQMKMTNGFMMPQVGDCNYNLNKDNEGFMNPNMYNQNGSNGYGNMNFYNSYKNM